SMAIAATTYSIRWPDWHDWRSELEMTDKGYFPGPFVDFADGSSYELFFYDPVRLSQELDMVATRGVPVIAEINMVVVPEVTPAAIQAAVEHLVRQGYFRHLKPVAPKPS